MTITQARIDALAARLTPKDVAAIASDWRAVGDDLRAAIDAETTAGTADTRPIARAIVDYWQGVRKEQGS